MKKLIDVPQDNPPNDDMIFDPPEEPQRYYRDEPTTLFSHDDDPWGDSEGGAASPWGDD